MQDVYLASDQLLGIDVALKTPQAGQQDRRFIQSAKIAAMVNHHNVAKTLDYFEEKRHLFLIEEYVPGETLEAKLARFGAVDPHLGARIFHHLSKGVAASHHVGVIHRDLKPSNIIVEAGVNLHQLKITDFGIATLTEEVFEEAAKDGDLTRSTSGTTLTLFEISIRERCTVSWPQTVRIVQSRRPFTIAASNSGVYADAVELIARMAKLRSRTEQAALSWASRCGMAASAIS